MAAPVRTPRRAWVEAGLRALAVGGPDAVRVESLATTLGVSKGGFYHHFVDRAALLEAMLETWEQRLVDEVIQRVDGDAGDARGRLHGLLTQKVDDDVLDVELAVRDWARRDGDVAARLARVDDRRMDYMRTLFRATGCSELEAEARGLLVLTLFIGDRHVAARHGTISRAQVAAAAYRLIES
jgi:AcrR family transcriptional regulator